MFHPGLFDQSTCGRHLPCLTESQRASVTVGRLPSSSVTSVRIGSGLVLQSTYYEARMLDHSQDARGRSVHFTDATATAWPTISWLARTPATSADTHRVLVRTKPGLTRPRLTDRRSTPSGSVATASPHVVMVLLIDCWGPAEEYPRHRQEGSKSYFAKG